jgi:hypothetical protein
MLQLAAPARALGSKWIKEVPVAGVKDIDSVVLTPSLDGSLYIVAFPILGPQPILAILCEEVQF